MVRLYKWTSGRHGALKERLTYAWYCYIEHRSEFERITSAHALNLILLAARKHRLNNKTIAEITLEDLKKIRSGLNTPFSNKKTQESTVLYLIKFLFLLEREIFFKWNLIDVAVNI